MIGLDAHSSAISAAFQAALVFECQFWPDEQWLQLANDSHRLDCKTPLHCSHVSANRMPFNVSSAAIASLSGKDIHRSSGISSQRDIVQSYDTPILSVMSTLLIMMCVSISVAVSRCAASANVSLCSNGSSLFIASVQFRHSALCLQCSFLVAMQTLQTA